MHTIIISRKFELTNSMKHYINNHTNSLEKYQLDILSARVIITYQEKKGNKKDEKKKKRSFGIEITLCLAHSNTLVVNQSDKDFYVAVDRAVEKMHKVLNRYHDKLKQKRTAQPKKGRKSEESKEVEEDEIVPMDLDLHKPTDIGDALEQLKKSSQQFFVFNDKDSKMRVIYKRADGKYGLY